MAIAASTDQRAGSQRQERRESRVGVRKVSKSVSFVITIS